jgi:hypothetical protein
MCRIAPHSGQRISNELAPTKGEGVWQKDSLETIRHHRWPPAKTRPAARAKGLRGR